MKISVTGIIGVIGSGKDTYKNSVIDNSEHCIVGDFSDGVREFVSSFIGFPISSLNEEEYRRWKDNHAVFVIGRNNLPNSKLTGRRLLENVGKLYEDMIILSGQIIAHLKFIKKLFL